MFEHYFVQLITIIHCIGCIQSQCFTSYVPLHALSILILELQLAGILGKNLLERNADLQAKLKRLEESTEETLTSNRVRGPLHVPAFV